MNTGPRVTVTKGFVNMEDFYLLTVKELPELSGFVEKEKFIFRSMVGGGGNGVSFLLRLAIVLLKDLNRIRKLNAFLPDVGNDIWKVNVCEGFLGIVMEWLEENGGKGNLLQITEALRSNGDAKVAELVEQLFLRYSLPLTAKDDEGRENNVYSLSKNVNGASGSKSANDVNSAVERALQNSVILEEVFKKLQPKEQKAFRLVTPVWMEETFSFWRKSAQLRIQVSGGGFDLLTGANKVIAMSSYMNMVELDRKLEGRKRGTATGSNYDLVRHPFRRYQLSYKDKRYGPGPHPLTITSFFCGSAENNFWKFCGPLIEDLQIEDATFDAVSGGKNSLYKTCEMLLLDAGPSLKKLKISKSCTTTDSRRQTPGIKNGRRKAFVEKKTFADNLHTLIVGMRTDDLGGILYICPSLKTLVIEIQGGINRLVYPAANGEYIKLETLKINYPCYSYANPHKFYSLRKYAELLASKQFNSLKHLCLDGVHLIDARHPPFDLYAALAHCSSTLKSLNLTVLVTKGDDLQEERKWFTDLASFSFPNLTMLKLSFDFDCRRCGLGFDRLDAKTKHMKFDFRTLEGMRMLEQLEIMVGKNDVRNPGAQDWICEGDRTSYLPSGVDFALNSDADPILCSNLKEFSFIGWDLNKNDIPLLSSWFPNLTRLDAVIKLEAVPFLLDNWSKLERIEIKVDRLISLLKFRPMKEKIKHLRVIQTISLSLGRTKCVELKVDNGMLYFLEHKDADKNDK